MSDVERYVRSARPAETGKHPVFIPEMSKVFDISRVWVTAGLEGIAYDAITDDHMLCIMAFLRRMNINVVERFPNLLAEARKRRMAA